MACNCKDEIEEKLAKIYQDKFPKREIKSIEMIDFLMQFKKNDLGLKSYTHVEIEFQGMRKKEKTNMIHTFCPFCGKRYEDKLIQEEAK